MSHAPLPPEILARCRELRKNATDAANLLWHILGNRQFGGFKFRRQVFFQGYILDFYCHTASLVIELDGGGHLEESQTSYDEARTEYLDSYGLRVIRF